MIRDPDVQHMLQLKQGNLNGFRILFTRYSKKIVNFCYRFCGDREMAEELAQEVFIRVYKAAPRYKPKASFSTWLFRIATNVCLNETRKYQYRMARERVETVESGYYNPEMNDIGRSSPHDLLEKKDDHLVLKQAIQSLPDKQKTALLLKVCNDFSYKDIGKQMKQSESAVKSLIHRARQALTKMLEHHERRD